MVYYLKVSSQTELLVMNFQHSFGRYLKDDLKFAERFPKFCLVKTSARILYDNVFGNNTHIVLSLYFYPIPINNNGE